MNEVIYKIRVNRPCRLFIDDEEMMILDENRLTKITLPEGEYLRKVVAIDNKAIFDEAEITLSGSSKLDNITLDTTGLEEAKRNALPKDEFQVGNLMYKAPESETGVAVAKYVDMNITEVIIPEEIIYGNYSYEVRAIEYAAFECCRYLTSVTIPNSVIEIGERAFWSCESLTSITIPNSVKVIENQVFEFCKSIKSVIIPNSVIHIGSEAFSCCSSLTSITIPNSVTSIETHAFAGTAIYNNKSNWKDGALYLNNCLIVADRNIAGNYSIKEGTRLIADWAFAYCSFLTSITIPNSVTSIGWHTFLGCKGLTSVTIPNSVTSIGCNVFADCSSMASVNIPNSVTNIKYGAFANCKGLTSINIPNSVISIEERAFVNCENLISCEIPNSVTNLEDDAFEGCDSLSFLSIPKSVLNIDWDALTSITKKIRE